MASIVSRPRSLLVPAFPCMHSQAPCSRPGEELPSATIDRRIRASSFSNGQAKCLRSPSVRFLRKEENRSVRAWGKSGDSEGEEGKDPWLSKMPDKGAPLYTHSLLSIEAWLKHLEFKQIKDDPAMWRIERPDWHAELAMDVTELGVRYLKSGPGNLSRDVERKFSYALSRQDLENAILGGP